LLSGLGWNSLEFLIPSNVTSCPSLRNSALLEILNLFHGLRYT
jgi:hypothetical protein